MTAIPNQREYLAKGEKFKNHVKEFDKYLRTDECIIVHIDGVDFTSGYYKKLKVPYDYNCFKAICNTAVKLCGEIKSARLCYVANDEIVVILDGAEIKENFHNRIQKISSILASMCSVYFIAELENIIASEFPHNKGYAVLKDNAVFAAKCFNLEKHYINEYFQWRQYGCKKSIFDKRLNYDGQDEWVKNGAVVLHSEDNWVCRTDVDLTKHKLVRSPQNKFYFPIEVKLDKNMGAK